MPRGVLLTGFVLFVLVIALVFPVMMGASGEEKRYYVELGETNTTAVGGVVNVTVAEVNDTGGYSKVRVTDKETLVTSEKTIDEGAESIYRFGPGNVTVGLNSTQPSSARLYVDVPSTYGWEGGAERIGEEMALILGGMAMIVVVVFAAAAAGGLQ